MPNQLQMVGHRIFSFFLAATLKHFFLATVEGVPRHVPRQAADHPHRQGDGDHHLSKPGIGRYVDRYTFRHR